MKLYLIVKKMARKLLMLFAGCLLTWNVLKYVYHDNRSTSSYADLDTRFETNETEAYSAEKDNSTPEVYSHTDVYDHTEVFRHTEVYKHPDTVLGMFIHRPTLLAGIQRKYPVTLTIGIPTVKRAYGSYLFDTLQSLIDGSTAMDRTNMTVVVFIADSDPKFNQEVLDEIKTKFPKELTSGFLQITRAPLEHYPSLLHLRITFGDSARRVAWRSKQNLDYAALMAYCQNISKYYLQLEDDVLAAPSYYNNIVSFINSKTQKWTMLDFSVLGFIGKLYHCTDLMKLAVLLRTYFNEQPCDFLLNHFLHLMMQDKRYVKKPSIFRHRGKHSSLTNVTRAIEKIDFPKLKIIHKGQNPPADLRTNMNVFEKNVLNNAYNSKSADSVFWAKTPKMGDFIEVMFKQPAPIRRIVVTTGFSAGHHRDVIVGARLDAGYDVASVNNSTRQCSDLHKLGEFVNGSIDVTVTNNSTLTACILITITKTQEMWIYVREIAVFV